MVSKKYFLIQGVRKYNHQRISFFKQNISPLTLAATVSISNAAGGSLYIGHTRPPLLVIGEC
ncbi:MAG: hypothetical protein OEY11_10440 [Gammaproteobacteria bacterium]|nr:hypothetical protein [Gammaproteobacteria bacterium]